ncbi:MAG: tRNA (N(6)-L-threonylcarbamoyladenosine(37)-C(2))-methylthiotransferase MtaB [Clostridia bacterium]|nr:tRNA (N(6)-L-threonylcarbamoyladenosine(37)-C(2))-methylthiotransferase MtaB [Clostridia bacterium]
MKISIIALGCKVNQYENEAIAKKLDTLGFDVSLVFEFADIYVLNTCAVTNEAERKSRQYVSKIIKQNPNAKIYVIGCAVSANTDQFLKKSNVEYILGNNHKELVIEAIIKNINGNFFAEPEKEYSEFEYVTTNHNNLSERVRKYIKIQDGCNNFCTYCAIPYLRGRSRSRKLENIVKEVEDVSKIANEIVITGINMSDYKIDGKLALPYVFLSLKHINSRIRIGSLEVNVITKEFLEALKQLKNFAEQFHLSLQSGSNRILKLMNRHYTTQDFLEKVNLIRTYFPNAAITTDLIVGFAKETEEDFLETMQTIECAKFSNMHIFEYSEKKGTKGVLLGKSPSQDIKQRLIKVNALAKLLKEEFENKFLGTTQTILIEEYSENQSIGLTGNYIKVFVNKKLEINKFYNVKLILNDTENGKIIGEVID